MRSTMGADGNAIGIHVVTERMLASGGLLAPAEGFRLQLVR